MRVAGVQARKPDPDPVEVAQMLAAVQEAQEKEWRQYGPDKVPRLIWPQASAFRFLSVPAPPMDWLFQDLVPRGIVGAFIATGGVGKSFLMLQLAVALASGQAFGPFKPPRSGRVLYLAGEDPDSELHRRVRAIGDLLELSAEPLMAENLGIYSTVGKHGPLIAMVDKGNPAPTEAHKWLDESLAELHVETLLIDPMSRFFGLSENDNAHMTAFVQMLECLALGYGLTVLFAHHEPKSAGNNEDLRQSSGRGGSALRDGCRWTAALRHMRKEDGNVFGVNPRDYVELDVSKSNYAPMPSGPVFFRRGEGGVLEPVNLRGERLHEMTKTLTALLAQEERGLSRRDLEKENAGNGIADAMKDAFKGFLRRRDMGKVIDNALSAGLLEEIEKASGGVGRSKKVLRLRSC